jgi:hypothetical protein
VLASVLIQLGVSSADAVVRTNSREADLCNLVLGFLEMLLNDLWR